ncbi:MULTISPECIES: amidase [Mycolicibacterium]|uniref:amidase n=1 Tax=Mycolicibacterium TaxID=1866885 RepID=UPI0009BFE5AC|nr:MULTISPECIES: amidase [Mycolicibacterium]MCW1822295.1 amidase [Mycolicibacterium senegalense]
MTQTCELSISAIAQLIRTGQATPSQVLQSCLDRIDSREPVVQAWEVLDIENARMQARALDDQPPRSPLHGVPVGVKDIIDVAGLPTRCGSPLRSDAAALQDAWIVSRLREAGAIILGKTVTTEFAYFTPGKTRNPHDVERTPGGSSSGSAAAVADRMVPFALGTQTAASTTRPAAYCGVAGLVLPPGSIDDRGVNGLSPTLDSMGFLARTVDDLALVANTLLRLRRPAHLDRAPALLVCGAEQFGELEASMHAALADSIAVLQRSGARIGRLDADVAPGSLAQAHMAIMAAEAAHSLAAESGRVSPALQALLDQGRATSERDYHRAIGHRLRHRNEVVNQMRGFDAILAPAAPGPAPLGMPTGSPAFSRPWQVMGFSSVTVPGPRDTNGMPLGLQLIGPHNDVPSLLASADWVQKALAVTD